MNIFSPPISEIDFIDTKKMWPRSIFQKLNTTKSEHSTASVFFFTVWSGLKGKPEQQQQKQIIQTLCILQQFHSR